MKLPARVLPEAERELERAFAWYEQQRPGLGCEFLTAFDAAVESLRRLPESHESVALRTRKALLRRFPYLLLYVVEPEQILITAVFHVRRDPQPWSDRVRDDAGSVEARDAIGLSTPAAQ
ncbi:MAG: type II toxin-antitoxin system RelE/ParE family toxin [Candidatus Eisenbacteria bacterium]